MIRGHGFIMIDHDEIWKLELITGIQEVVNNVEQNERTRRNTNEPISRLGEDRTTITLA